MLLTWESELRAIAEEAARWTVETGGDLFGLWGTTPTIYLATRTGPLAVRDRAHFRLDVDYLRTLSETLAVDWSLRYLGDWHSHHRLGLPAPSHGDRHRLLRLAARNGFSAMSEIIVTFDGGTRDAPAVRAHPWVYANVRNASDPTIAELTLAPARVRCERRCSRGGPCRNRHSDAGLNSRPPVFAPAPTRKQSLLPRDCPALPQSVIG